jgi:hypothetical protein
MIANQVALVEQTLLMELVDFLLVEVEAEIKPLQQLEEIVQSLDLQAEQVQELEALGVLAGEQVLLETELMVLLLGLELVA